MLCPACDITGVLVPLQASTLTLSPSHYPHQSLDMSERHSPTEIVLLDAVASSLGGRVIAVPPGDVHTDHIPQVPLERPAVVVRSTSRGVWYWLWLHHGHDRAGLLGAAAVGHGAGEARRVQLATGQYQCYAMQCQSVTCYSVKCYGVPFLSHATELTQFR